MDNNMSLFIMSKLVFILKEFFRTLKRWKNFLVKLIFIKKIFFIKLFKAG